MSSRTTQLKNTHCHVIHKPHLLCALNRGYGGIDRSSFTGREGKAGSSPFVSPLTQPFDSLVTYILLHRSYDRDVWSDLEWDLRDIWMSVLTLHLTRKTSLKKTGHVTLPTCSLTQVLNDRFICHSAPRRSDLQNMDGDHSWRRGAHRKKGRKR